MAEWKEQSLRLWQNLGKKQRYMILGSAILIFTVVLAWSFWWGGKPDLVPLFTDLEAKDAGEIVGKLKEMKVSHEIAANGSAIMVQSKDVYRVRLELASQGLPKGNKGFEIFEQSKFGATEFQNKVNLVQALQGELARTIEQMPEVEKARVHIVLSEDSLYKKNEKPATASIMLKLKPSSQLSKDQVKGVVNLVAHSIQGLKAENVTVIDQMAHVLNDPNDNNNNNLAGSATLTQIEMTKKVQEDLQKSLQSLLEQVLGPNKAAARVNVELSFDQRTVDKQVFEPVVDDKGIVRSSQELNEKFKGTSPNPGGVPGTASNIPGYVTNGVTQQSDYEKKEVTRNYEINETKEKVVATPGSVKRLTVAVLVDASLNKAQQDSIAKIVASAIGVNPTRGDTVSVESIAFNTEAIDKQRKDELDYENQQKQMLWLKIALAVLFVLAVLYAVRMASRRRQKEEAIANGVVDPEFEELEPEMTEEKELSPQEKAREEQRLEVEKIAKAKPEEVAQLIKVWLSEE